MLRRHHLALSALVLTSSLVLAACGSSEGGDATASATPSATTSGVATNVVCSDLTVDESSTALPTLAGEAGTTPTPTWTGEAAPTNLTVATLEEGDGPTVTESDFISVSYAGWKWDSDATFDSSYDRAKPTTFSLQGVITGWRCGLAGHKVGDRVLMSVPSQYAYGETSTNGSPTGPLVFVVEIKAIGTTAGATVEGEQALADRGVTVTGELGAAASVSVSEGAAEPTQTEVIVLARGTGAAITAEDTIGLNMAFTSWDGSVSQSSWEQASPQYVTMAQAPGLSGLVGVPAGSRVVVLMPAGTGSSGEAVPAFAYVLDIAAIL
ncbi:MULTISPECIES: FKBP-type peptidyl-prolyl cis-trans isomerase [unclassified Actinomyces]|uniref:FKBP-type peptidyl-prolyl cis-trans isomerase n=1 Tax=unclassified Actinomyces TaxID=2609248 RepID=UPI002018296A|nr:MULTISPECIES: FKBP-type peptidyl-prolyl cis-trans isomerase [unclassified Actinomyces]MCL3777574.1 FKBP-type peptidyl-prolyl cis-trans isomerase [Actinomyces sp. AC-20-1]MCL3789557.1 FKBP-type peptidyl-prolyl cis-trans isomerase [Actinomyces sp. 187325]MCL3791085.1 FKBP-type peptidyl-prolyl cis-trans isomerase [Actinomyces sp. 186855]MCL3793389.1 FKBP-type peptidyl-prolyl cis-trans isomerase [Actinomyces sp. 217892]